MIFFGFIIIFTSGDCLRFLPCGVGQGGGGGGGGGGRAPALSQKPSYLRERLHDPDIFENTYYFLRESAFRPHETNESAHRNLHHFETAFQSVLRPPSRRIWVKTCGFNWNSTLQHVSNIFLIVNVIFLETITVLIALHIFPCFKLFCSKAIRTEKVTHRKNCFQVYFSI